MPSSFRDRVAIVTGAGGGLGRAHALALAREGARVIVNDLAPAGLANATSVVDEIRSAGGTAIAHGASVTDPQAVADMVDQAIATWGRIDILVNNAGLLRDKSFAKCTPEDFRLVLEVHLMGAFHCCKAVWPHMRAAGYGRIVMTTSASGLYGNFGQAGYAAAKMALVGLMNTLHIEGQKHDIRVNALAPTAYTQMLEGLVDPAMADRLTPESIAPGLLYLASVTAPSKLILGAGSGGFAVNHIFESEGLYLAEAERTPDAIAAAMPLITGQEPAGKYAGAFDQTDKFLRLASHGGRAEEA
jgi:NAD(P)-dependent dehydrogenase (short-subunit alcohol dehydrogenase family)